MIYFSPDIVYYIHIAFLYFIFRNKWFIFSHFVIMKHLTKTVGRNFDQLIGSRAQVWHGTAYKTTGGLTKSNLMMSHGRIVSLKKHKTAKKEKRLEKAGYFTKKGQFGFVKKTLKSRRRGRKMRGGDPNNDYNSDVANDDSYVANDGSNDDSTDDSYVANVGSNGYSTTLGSPQSLGLSKSKSSQGGRRRRRKSRSFRR